MRIGYRLSALVMTFSVLLACSPLDSGQAADGLPTTQGTMESERPAPTLETSARVPLDASATAALPEITWCAPPATGVEGDAFRSRLFDARGRTVLNGGDHIRFSCTAPCAGSDCNHESPADGLTYRFYVVDGMAGVLRFNAPGSAAPTVMTIHGGFSNQWPKMVDRGTPYPMSHVRDLGVRVVELRFLDGIQPDAMGGSTVGGKMAMGIYSRTSAAPSSLRQSYARAGALFAWTIDELSDRGEKVTTFGCSGGSQLTMAATALLGLAPKVDYQFFCGGPKMYDHRFTCRNAPGFEAYERSGDMGAGQRLLMDYLHGVENECANTAPNPNGVDNLSPAVRDALHAASIVSLGGARPPAMPTVEYMLNVRFDASGQPLARPNLPLDVGILLEGDNARHGIAAHVAYDLAHEQTPAATNPFFYEFAGKQSSYGDASGKMNVRAVIPGNLFVQEGTHCDNMAVACRRTAAYLGLSEAACTAER